MLNFSINTFNVYLHQIFTCFTGFYLLPVYFFIIVFDSLTDEDISGEKAIPLMYLKFQNVQHLTVSVGTACNHRLLVC